MGGYVTTPRSAGPIARPHELRTSLCPSLADAINLLPRQQTKGARTDLADPIGVLLYTIARHANPPFGGLGQRAASSAR